MLGLAPESKLVQGTFLSGAIGSVPDSIEKMATARNGAEFRDAATELGINIGMAALMGKGMAHEDVLPSKQPETPPPSMQPEAENVAPAPNAEDILPSEAAKVAAPPANVPTLGQRMIDELRAEAATQPPAEVAAPPAREKAPTQEVAAPENTPLPPANGTI
jgi:hypothetical protein